MAGFGGGGIDVRHCGATPYGHRDGRRIRFFRPGRLGGDRTARREGFAADGNDQNIDSGNASRPGPNDSTRSPR